MITPKPCSSSPLVAFRQAQGPEQRRRREDRGEGDILPPSPATLRRGVRSSVPRPMTQDPCYSNPPPPNLPPQGGGICVKSLCSRLLSLQMNPKSCSFLRPPAVRPCGWPAALCVTAFTWFLQYQISNQTLNVEP